MLNFARWKIILISLVCFWGVLTSIPNLLSERMLQRYPDFLPTSTVTLGLDLQGGIDMLISVDVEGAMAARIEGLRDQARLAMRGTDPRTGYTLLRVVGEEVQFRITNEDQYDAALEALQVLIQPILTAGSIVPTNNFEIIDEGDRSMVIRFTDQGRQAEAVNIVNQTINVLRQRIDELGTLDPSLQRQGADRIRVQIPGLQDRSVIIDIIEKQAVMTFQMVDHSVTQQDIQRDLMPPGTRLFPSNDGVMVPLETRVRLTGENLKDANATFDGQTGIPAVSFRLDGQGARIFGQITSANVGKQFAILLDGEIISYPVINSPILGGSGQISGGSMTTDEANTLAILLRAGAAPAAVEIEEERTVGPDMGSDSVAAGKIAALIGMVLVLVFIILSYGLFGLAANLALVFNIAILFGALSLLGATLTLPGIAGIVLTIGMAVDANVLVFERIREELKLGRGPFNAVETGYRTALSTILDANITTLIAAIILFQFGTGPIRGFAITLMIGIITSVFTAVTLTRMFVSLYLHKRRPKTITV